jgi:DICT domain-containing protein
LSTFELTIGDLSNRTGVAEATLRVWERRYGFPRPVRTPSRHRRYSDEQVELIERVLSLRAAGLSLTTAIERAQTAERPRGMSLFSLLLRRRPELDLSSIRKPTLIAFSRAIEDEVLARAEAEVMFGCFQREMFYRSSEGRWRELCESAVAAAVFADFGSASAPDRGPAEIPIDRRQQIAREWAIVAYGGRSSICMVARESASSNVDAPSPERTFEMVWTANPAAVRDLAQACANTAAVFAPKLAERAATVLDDESQAIAADPAPLTTAILNRTLGHLR